MGGKKQAQRTKNNARPSSSSRSAEILGNTVPNFVGFSAVKDGGLVAFLPGFSNKEDIDPNIDPNLQMALKKFGKKDSTTKLKALNEFTAFVSTSEESIVCTALSLWPRYYCQLSIDIEHRIREATQVAHAAIVKRCGRSIAPFLKQLIPVWITSQYDTYVPAALQAQNSLEAVFPAAKLPEVLSFCKTEILSFILDNLTMHTANTLSNVKIHTPEEREAKYERVIIATLQGYSLLINSLPEAQLEWLCAEQIKILDNSRFWSYGTHKSAQIRTSYFIAIGSLSQRLGAWFGLNYGAKAADLFLSHLNDKELNVSIAVWENCVIFMANVPEWSKFMNIDKALPSICETLGAGGWGSAGRIAPLMLPLLAHLSDAALDHQVCDAYFEAILKGAEQRCVVTSKSECSAWMNGLAECLKFISVKLNSTEYALQSLSRALRLWLSYISQAHNTINPYTPLKVSVCSLRELIQYWVKQSLNQNSNTLFYTQLTRLFWKNVIFVIKSQMESIKPDDEIKEMTGILSELLTGLKSNLHVKMKKGKVKFDSDQPENKEVNTNKTQNETVSTVETDISSSVKQEYERELNTIVNEACGLYLEWAIKRHISAPILESLYSLILQFNSVQVFNTMLSYALKNNENNKIVNLYTDLFFDWLREDSMRSQSVVDLTFALFTYLSDEEQRDVLKTMNQMPVSVIKWCISRCLCFPYCSYSTVRDWLKGDLVHKSLISLANNVISEGDKYHASLLKICFSLDKLGETPISEKTYSEIILLFGKSLYQYDSIHLDMCASFASQLASSFCTDEKYDTFHELLLGLFAFNCSVQGGTEILSQDTWWEVNTSWQDALSGLSWHNLVKFCKTASNVIFSKLISCDFEILNAEVMDKLVGLSFNLLCSCVDTNNLKEDNFDHLCQSINILMKTESEEVQTWLENMYSNALIADILNSKLDCPISGSSISLENIIRNSDKKSYNDITTMELKKQLTWLLFCTKFSQIILKHSESSNIPSYDSQEDNEDDEIEMQLWPANIISGNNMKGIFTDLMYNITVVRTVYDECQGMEWCGILKEYYPSIESTACCIMNLLSNKDYLNILEYMKSKATTEGIYWSVCLQFCTGILKPSEKILDFDQYLIRRFKDCLLKKGNFEESVKKHLPYYMQIQDTETNDNSDEKLCTKAILSARSICISQWQKSADVTLTKEEMMCCVSFPLASLTLVVDKYYQCKKLMLYDIHISSASWDLISCNVSILRFLTASVELNGWNLEAHHWDFINISLSSFIRSIDKSKNAWNTTKVSSLSCEVFKLFCAVDQFIKNIPEELTRREPVQCLLNLPQEWVDIFIVDMYPYLIDILYFIFVNCVSIKSLPFRDIFIMNNLYEVITKLDIKYLSTNSKHSVDSIMDACLEILSCPTHHVLKCLAHEMLKKLTPLIITADKVASNSTFTEERETPILTTLSVHKMAKTLTHLQECVDIVLSPYTVGENNCTLIPFMDSYNMTLGYLLLWETLLSIAEDSVSVLQYQYTEFFKQEKYVEHLVCALFRLMPHDLSQNIVFFKNPPRLLPKTILNWELISGMSCGCLVQSLLVGAVHIIIRGWWGALPSRMAQYVDRIVRTHITPLLVSFQLTEVAQRQKELPNVEFLIHPSSNEVVSKYKFDQSKMLLSIELSNNHPLGNPKVTSNGGPTQNVAWITLFLAHQNGTLWQTIVLWINSIHKKLDSTTECYVCYCKIHPVTGKLPKISCFTCKNKIHSVCLNKWFASSGKSTCPICRANLTK